MSLFEKIELRRNAGTKTAIGRADTLPHVTQNLIYDAPRLSLSSSKA